MAASGDCKRWSLVQKICGLTIGQLDMGRRYGYPRTSEDRSQHWDTALLAATVKIAQNEQNRAKESPSPMLGRARRRL